MRTALLSALERTKGGHLCAFELLGGRPLFAWQLDYVRDLGCERVICLVAPGSGKAEELARLAEAAGLNFHPVAGPLPLVGLLSADQTLVVIADGLVVDRGLLEQTLGGKQGVVSLPDEPGIAAGFERIDAEHAWGGILISRANIAAQLADMSPDSDAVSLLLRLALQSGAKLIPLPSDVLDSGEWLLVRERSALAAREKALLDKSVGEVSWTAPSFALGSRLARQLLPGAMAKGPALAIGGGLFGLLAALACAAFGLSFVALVILAVAGFVLATGRSLADLKGRLLGSARTSGKSRLLDIAYDAVFIAVLTLPLTTEAIAERVFLPLIAIGLVRLAEKTTPNPWSLVFSDRPLLAAILLIPAWFGVLEQALSVICLLALFSCLFSNRNRR